MQESVVDDCKDFAIFLTALSGGLLTRRFTDEWAITFHDLVLLFGFPIYCLTAELLSSYVQWNLAGWLNREPDSCVWWATGN